MSIWFTSDLHFCHDKEFLYGPRGFTNVGDMNEELIKKWNDVVTMEDIVYVLGDLMLNNDEKALRCIERLNGTLHVILGNHDTENRILKYCDTYNIASVKFADRMRLSGFNFFLCHYPTICSNFDEEDRPLRTKTINLCGHTHTKDRYVDINKGLIYHVEVDAHDNTPVSLEQVIQDMNGIYYGKIS